MHSRLFSGEQSRYGKLFLINAWPVPRVLILQSNKRDGGKRGKREGGDKKRQREEDKKRRRGTGKGRGEVWVGETRELKKGRRKGGTRQGREEEDEKKRGERGAALKTTGKLREEKEEEKEKEGVKRKGGRLRSKNGSNK